jgi:hypothetical protein
MIEDSLCHLFNDCESYAHHRCIVEAARTALHSECPLGLVAAGKR